MIFAKPLSFAGLSLGLVGLLAAATPLLSGCDTKAYCFANCGGGAPTTASTGTSQGGSGGMGGGFSSSTGFSDSASGQGGGTCTPTNGGIEACDHIDNDCNGFVDDIPGNVYDGSKPKTCGTCDNNCYALPGTNWDAASVTCTLPANAVPGVTPGTCAGACTADYYDLNHDGTCEYFCTKTANDDTTCDNKDDDCDGLFDEDVDLCTSLTDCGKCGGNCVVVNGTPKCTNNGMMPCGPMNTKCEIAACNPGWVDLDHSYATGCEYHCTPTGPEICGDGIDNDCNGFIDSADPNIGQDPQIGVACFGGTQGICAAPAHAGLTACVANAVTCVGANVVVPGQITEKCNGLDDNCDGVVDNNPSDAGSACGTNNTFPCRFGQNQCQNGSLVCVGAVNPQTETCNGQDDNCDGVIDKTGANPPADSVGTCNVPIPPPMGATSPCMAGMKACVGGTVICQGSVGPTSQTDACGVDSNCNGILENQPNKQTDVHNCGSCGHDCTVGALNANWSCQAGACHFDGCLPGWNDLNNDQKCEYACTFVSAQEACNGQDDNCNGQVDEGVIAPSPVSVCGVSPTASTPECTTGVNVACTAGAWKCTFPAGVCTGAAPNQCSSTAEICDTLDNNCNGFVNETSPNYGKTCASDDGKPPPGDGACRTVGTYVCNPAVSTTATKCSAVTANCASLPGGCTEKCDGIDNDCDGLIDEPYSNKGTNTANFYKPNVVKIGPALWVYEYEASRPKADGTVPGSGNGYFTSAPSGTTLDKTPSCSEPGRIPWFNVTPDEVEQTCAAMGGVVCATTEWQQGCHAGGTPNCSWGYNPHGAACTSSYTGTKYCNLGPSYDFDPVATGDQDGLLPTGSAKLQNCFGDWSLSIPSPVAPQANKLFDITGNLREITKSSATVYNLMGGAFNSGSEAGATCDFTFYAVNKTFKFYDTGFRCCFDFDPTL